MDELDLRKRIGGWINPNESELGLKLMSWI